MPATENQTTLIYEHHQGDTNGERTAYPVEVAEFTTGFSRSHDAKSLKKNAWNFVDRWFSFCTVFFCDYVVYTSTNGL
jgi:hypothetical protein